MFIAFKKKWWSESELSQWQISLDNLAFGSCQFKHLNHAELPHITMRRKLTNAFVFHLYFDVFFEPLNSTFVLANLSNTCKDSVRLLLIWLDTILHSHLPDIYNNVPITCITVDASINVNFTHTKMDRLWCRMHTMISCSLYFGGVIQDVSF